MKREDWEKSLVKSKMQQAQWAHTNKNFQERIELVALQQGKLHWSKYPLLDKFKCTILYEIEVQRLQLARQLIDLWWHEKTNWFISKQGNSFIYDVNDAEICILYSTIVITN